MPLISQHSPYDSQLRRRVVYQHFVGGLGYKEISGLLGGKPAARTVGRICAEYKKRGRWGAKRGRLGSTNVFRKFDDIAWEVLVMLVQEEETSTLQEIGDEMERRLGRKWTSGEISMAMKESGFVRKKLVNRAVEAKPELQAKYRRLVERRGYSADMCVFIDEVGTVRA